MVTTGRRPGSALWVLLRGGLLLSSGFSPVGCGDSGPARGTEGGWCYADGTCNEGLICVGKHCVNPYLLVDASVLPDAPSSVDAGESVDAPPHVDALYCPGMPDASTEPDADAPDASSDATSSPDAATSPCDPAANTGCAPGEKCTWIFDASLVAHTGCTADGWVTVRGCTCELDESSGADDCRAGMYCVSGTCQEICNSAPDSCPQGFRCTAYAALFDDVENIGICDPSCDPVAQDCENPGQACYLNAVTGASICAAIPVGAEGKLQGDTCYGPQPEVCYINGCDEGYGPLLPDSTCTFFCNPIDNWAGNVQGLSGDPTGITCAFTSTDRPSGPGASFECRFVQSFYSNAEQVPATVGMCVDPDEYGGSCDAFDYDGLAADIESGAVESETYCDDYPNRCMFDCISLATFDALRQ